MVANPKPPQSKRHGPRTVKPLAIPEAQEMLGMRLAILCGHKLYDKAIEVIEAERAAQRKLEPQEPITLDSLLSVIPGLDHRAVCNLENVGVYTIRAFRSYFIRGELMQMQNVGQITIDKVAAAIRALPASLLE